LGVSPDGTRVFVTGTSYDPAGTSNYTTIAYGASTGATLWRKGYNGPPNQSDNALDLAVSPDSSQVFVTGESTGSSNTYDYATLAYDASTGTLLWKTRYNGPGNGDDSARSIVAYPFGTKVFITGSSIGPELNADYETIAYSA
jgi:DNA-binding beta-propeller fold protein YncE